MRLQHDVPVYHVMPDGDGEWLVKRQGYRAPSSFARTLRGAIRQGEQWARAAFGRLIIHDARNRIAEHRDCTAGPRFLEAIPGASH